MTFQGFSHFKMDSPACHPGVIVYSADFTLHEDVSHLFPYINAVAEDPVYFEIPDTIQFKLQGRRCALYGKRLVVGGFGNRDSAILFFEVFSEFINGIMKNRPTITPDYKRYKPVPVMDIFKLLPRSNCKECGFPTCLAFAAALSKGEILMDKCPAALHPDSAVTKQLNALFS
jgi:ArsR family metal-binding transcriptional regulator